MNTSNYNDDGVFSSIDKCPCCGSIQAKVIDSRFDTSGCLRIRKKSCIDCGHHWRTVEILESDFECVSELVLIRDISRLHNVANTLFEASNKFKKPISDAKVIEFKESVEKLKCVIDTLEETYREPIKSLLNLHRHLLKSK